MQSRFQTRDLFLFLFFVVTRGFRVLLIQYLLHSILLLSGLTGWIKLIFG